MKTADELDTNRLVSEGGNGHPAARSDQPAGANGGDPIRLKEMGFVAAILAHELRQPLGAIQSLAWFLKSNVSSADPAVTQSLNLLAEQTELAGRILSNLAAFARSGSPRRSPTDLHPVIKEVLQQMAWPAEIRRKQKLAPRLPAVFVDALQVERILLNLISNALESMEGPGTVTIATQAHGSDILVEITDTGCGMEPAQASTIFQPFMTTKRNGTGLGLAVSRELAEANGGSIIFQSEPGKGATFTLRLPLA